MVAIVHDTADLELPPAVVFDHVVDVSNLAAWGANFTLSARRDRGELGAASAFRVVAEVAERTIGIDYVISTHDRPLRATLVGAADTFTLIDRIRVLARPGGAVLHWRTTVDADTDPLDALAVRVSELVVAAALAGLRGATAAV